MGDVSYDYVVLRLKDGRQEAVCTTRWSKKPQSQSFMYTRWRAATRVSEEDFSQIQDLLREGAGGRAPAARREFSRLP